MCENDIMELGGEIMKKLLIGISICLLLVGCSTNQSQDKEKEETNNSLDKFNEEYYNLAVMDISDVDDLSTLYQKEYKEALKQGYTSIIIGKQETLADTLEDLLAQYSSYDEMYKEIKKGSATIDVKAFFKQEKEMYKDTYDEWQEEVSSVNSYDAYEDLYILADEIGLALVPSDKPYEVFAYLPMGNFNDCPSNETLIAVFKHWYEDYGIVPAIITYDCVHISFTKKLSKEELEQLADEILLLNIETQYGAYPSKEDLVKGLKHSKYWMFWWD